MKASELMIGDWVRLIADDSNECLQVEYVRKDGVGFKQYNHLFDEIEPIPITEDILNANGFDQGSGMASGAFYYGDFRISASAFGIYTKIKYVHELQHALRLCGLNELANNFKVIK